MISTIIDFLSGIANFFEQVFKFIGFLVSEIIQIFNLAISSLGYITQFLTSVPVLAPCLLAAITIMLIYKIKE